MKSLISALVISVASVLPATASSIHDFNPTNAAPTPTRTKAQVGQGQCVTTRDRSKVCFIKVSATHFSIAISDIDYPNTTQAAFIDCSTGRWNAYGDLPKATLDQYFSDFCPTFG